MPITTQRLFGWRLDPLSGRMTALVPNADGSLWSEELASFLVPDGQLLRLFDRHRQRRLTEAEAEAAARRAEARARQAEAEARQAAERRAEAQATARQAAEQRAEALAEKLRSLGVDPEQA